MGAPPQLNPVLELDGTGAVLYRYVYATMGHSPDYVVNGAGATYRVVRDQLGSPLLIVNITNPSDVLLDARYSAFGTRTATTVAASAPTLGYAGGIYDEDTGLVRFGARDYDAMVGRWTSKDPILWDGGQGNLYVYVGNEPINRFDPLGADAWSAAGAFAQGFAFGAAGAAVVWFGLGTGTVVGGLVAVAVISTGVASGAVTLAELVSGRDLGGNTIGFEGAIDRVAGLAGGLLGGSAFARGSEFWIGSNVRVAPFGNRTGNEYGEYPHYHRRIPHPNARRARKGESAPGGSIDRHRPWEPAGSDKSWCDRF